MRTDATDSVDVVGSWEMILLCGRFCNMSNHVIVFVVR